MIPLMDKILHHLGWLRPYTVNNGIIIILAGAGFCPSTVGIILGENSPCGCYTTRTKPGKAIKLLAFVSVWETKNLIWNEHRYCFIPCGLFTKGLPYNQCPFQNMTYVFCGELDVWGSETLHHYDYHLTTYFNL